MKRILLLLFSLVFAQQKSIHQLENEFYKQHYPNLSEEEYAKLQGYTPPKFPSNQKTNACNLTKKVMGYHPYWVGTAYTGYDWSVLSHVIYFSYEVNENTGDYNNIYAWKTTNLVPTAHANGVKVQLCATLFGSTKLSTFLSNATARQRCIDSLVSLVQLRNADGVNIDFEGLPSSQKANFVQFMTDLSTQLKAAIPTAEVSIALPAVDWANAFDVVALLPVVDQFMIMGYDFYWSTASSAGPTGLLYTGSVFGSRCNSRSINDYLAKGIPPSKLILIVPYYSFRYPTADGTLNAATTGSGISRTYATAKTESGTYGSVWEDNTQSRWYKYTSAGQWYQCYWHDSLSLARMYDVVDIRGIAGIGMWALSYDGSNTELWNLLRERFTDCAQVPCSGTLWDMGGPLGNYWNRESWTYTLAPTGASQVTLNFTSFSLENGFDTLFIYDGNSVSSPLIGSYTGNNSPGNITASGAALTLRYKSDGATTGTGWTATWNCSADNTPPTTAVIPTTWQNNDFDLSFNDNDNGTIKQRFYLIADTAAGEWSANENNGFLFEDFTNLSGWTNQAGTWNATSSLLQQTDEANSNTNLYYPLTQNNSYTYIYRWKQKINTGTSINKRAGLHFFCDDATQTNRGNSYFIYLREDNDKIQWYEVNGNTFTLVLDIPYTINSDQWYDCKVLYNPQTGEFSFWLDNQYIATWTDATPLTTGNFVSFRTGNAIVDFDSLMVFKNRNATTTVLVRGASPDVRYSAYSPTSLSAKAFSLITDAANNISQISSEYLKVDTIKPGSDFTNVANWYSANTTYTFQDKDNIFLQQAFYQLLYFDGTNWFANTNNGYFYDDFATISQWTTQTGTWLLNAGTLQQTDETNSNTNIYATLTQDNTSDFLYHFQMNIGGTGTNRRAGMHFFCDNATLPNRGNSYFVYLRADNNKVQIYEVVADAWTLVQDVPFTVNAGQWYDVKIKYSATSGEIVVYVDNEKVASWTDPTPLTTGNAISLRTGNANVSYDNVRVYRSRSINKVAKTLAGIVNVFVGTNTDFAFPNPNPTTPAGQFVSLLQDSAGNWNLLDTLVNVDYTPPTNVSVVNDGTGADIDLTTNGTQLSANWTPASDPNSDIAYYEYAIGTSPGATDVVPFTNNGNSTTFTHTGLSLTLGQTYYVTVRAYNNAGLLSNTTTSDGVLYDSPSPIVQIQLSARSEQGKNILIWKPDRPEIASFKLFKSADGTDYSLLSETSDRNFTDFSPYAVTYYKVLGYDENGTSYVSNTVAVKLNEHREVFVYPNPVPRNSYLYLRYSQEIQGNPKYILLSLNGKKIKEFTTYKKVGNLIVLDLSEIASGTYILLREQSSMRIKIIVE